MLEILYEDKYILAVWKPAGLESQSARGFQADMVSEIRRHIHSQSPKSGEPYVGVIHRLDKPVSGILVYAKEKKAAAALSRQVAEGKMDKRYLAVVCGKVPENGDKFVDYLLKDEKENRSRIVDMGTKGAKRAELSYRVLGRVDNLEGREEALSLVEIELKTGRHHQIRVQMAGHGLPLWGDKKYNSFPAGSYPAGPDSAVPPSLALAAYRLSFLHPVTGEPLSFTRFPDGPLFHLDWRTEADGCLPGREVK